MKLVLRPACGERLPVPVDFRRHFISFIKTLLAGSEFYGRFEQEKPGYSPYVFGVQFGKMEELDPARGVMVIRPPVTVTFSTGVFDILTAVCNRAIALKGKAAVLNLVLDSIQILPHRTIKSRAAEFKLVGHAVLRGRDKYLEPLDAGEIEEAVNTHMHTRGHFLRKHFSGFLPDPLYPVKVLECGGLKKGVCHHYGGKITSVRGSVVLGGHPKSLQFLYDFGLGVRSGQGFGLLEVARQL